MDKRTLLAVVLSLAVMIIWGAFTNFGVRQPETLPPQNNSKEISETGEIVTPIINNSPISSVDDQEAVIKEISVSTSVYKIKLSTKGGVVKSIQLPEFLENDGTPVEMIISKETGEYPFVIKFGDYSTEDLVFNYTQSSDKKSVTFFKTIMVNTTEGPQSFILKKIFSFKDNDYALDFTVYLEGQDGDSLPLNFDNKMYTLTYGPQIGPRFEKLKPPNEYRNFLYYSNAKRNDFTSKTRGKATFVDKIVNWAAIEGKYFVVIASPPTPFLEARALTFSNIPQGEVVDIAKISFSRPLTASSRVEDKFLFYIGPKRKSSLSSFSAYNFDKAIKNNAIIGWLVIILKNLLIFLNKILGNWGVAIIVMTILIKVIFFPLTQKGFKSNTKLQALTPKANEIRERLKANPQKMNEELAGLYKKEGVNPLGGCLYMVIQMPIFFALYNLLNTHFELRGASFIAGWMGDLSSPETFLTIPFDLPFFGNQFRILPFVMLGMTFLQQKLSTTPNSSQQNNQMKYIMYLMPLFFFFILYNMPSGLVVYWTMQNILTVFQQMYINKTLKAEKSSVVEDVKPITKSKPRRKK